MSNPKIDAPSEIGPEKKTGGLVSRRFLVLLLTALILAVAVILLFYVFSVPEPATTPVDGVKRDGSLTEQHTPTTQQYTDDQIELIVSNSQPLMREELLENSVALAICLATEEKNQSVCSLLESADRVKECEQNYNLVLSYKNECEDLIVLQEGSIEYDSSFCEKLNSLSCGGLPGDAETVCRYLVENDLDLCLGLPGSSQQGCSDYLNLYNSVKKADAGYCDDMTTSHNEVLCDSLLSGDCSGSIDRLAKDSAYLLIANSTDNLDVCDKITYEHIRDSCKARDSLQEIA